MGVLLGDVRGLYHHHHHHRYHAYIHIHSIIHIVISRSEVPRPSGHCDKVAQVISDIGRKLGHEVARDKIGNVRIRMCVR